MKNPTVMSKEYKNWTLLPYEAYVNFDLLFDIKYYEQLAEAVYSGTSYGEVLSHKDIKVIKGMVKDFNLDLREFAQEVNTK